jgi:glycerol-3-phosphate acyltransferase PlsY
MHDLLLITAGYLIGSIPWGYIVPKLLRGVDIRTVGSGNLGAANVWRALGFKAGLAVALLDVGKGLAAALLGLWAGNELTGLLAGIAAMVGHWRPLFMGLARGGKIVATTAGVALALAPLAFSAMSVVWVVTFLLTRYTSVASMLAALALPLFALAFGSSVPVVVFSAGAALAILVLHRANIRRLLTGTENRFELRRRPRRSGEARTEVTRPVSAPRGLVRRAFRRLVPGEGRTG